MMWRGPGQVHALKRWTSLAGWRMEEGQGMITRPWKGQRGGGVACREGGRRKRVLEARPAEHSASTKRDPELTNFRRSGYIIPLHFERSLLANQ